MRSRPRWPAIAVIDQPWARSRHASKYSAMVSIPNPHVQGVPDTPPPNSLGFFAGTRPYINDLKIGIE
ncbi:hypothetical protein GCM10023235_35060 [Kitasatospora terrestris]|uniref:Uncharacterized protein n=1 Tax=Kitasatospora terrestris TaxID=258051 RepID=A0ABP9DPZ7_9ACTN